MRFFKFALDRDESLSEKHGLLRNGKAVKDLTILVNKWIVIVVSLTLFIICGGVENGVTGR
ncbi:hypothetical protein DYD21_07765 [Rhodohalobacter sp. SW132]|nr:hypothetical protein DYD21_07765 [Rhodohalobacter sp. SW132]